MRTEGPGSRLTIFVDETDQHDQPLATAIVLRARELGMAGAKVLREIEGFDRETVEILRYQGRPPESDSR